MGAQKAEKLLTEQNLFSSEDIQDICQAIRYHNTVLYKGEYPLLEILRAADMMDMFGVISIQRALESKAHLPKFDPNNIKGETWSLSASQFDKRFKSGLGIGPTIVDQINFQISCFDNLTIESAKEAAKPLIEEMRQYILNLDHENSK